MIFFLYICKKIQNRRKLKQSEAVLTDYAYISSIKF